MDATADTIGREFRDDTRRGALPADVIRRLNRLDPVKATGAVAATFGVLGACIAAALTWWTPAVIVPAVLIIASRQHALFVLAHDAAHYRLYRNRSLNDLVGRLCGLVTGISMCTYRVIHRLHHNHLYEDQDPDVALHGGYPRGRAYLVRKLLKDLTGLTAWKTYRYFFGSPAINKDSTRQGRPLDDTSAALRAAARGDRWLVAGFHVAALAGSAATGFALEYAILWLLPLVTLVQALLRLRAICEHGAVTDLSSALTAARTNLAPAPVLWLFFPHHVNFHVEHHVYPAIPHYNLPACHNEMAARGLLKNAEVSGLRQTFARIFAAPVTSK